MGLKDSLKKVGGGMQADTSLGKELNAKLAEIDEAIANLNDQRLMMETIIDERIDRILEEKLNAHNVQIESVHEYKNQNSIFISELRENIRSRYHNFIEDNMRVLQKAKERLLLFKDFQLQ
ncbi:MAG: hypothetical protein M0Z67_11015 [Nitrospiraceae bacterium]|nr:hypothetical protein [Nitrospiraceae bacterium]